MKKVYKEENGWEERGFVEKVVKMKVRKNKIWVQCVIEEKDGSEGYWIMKRVESLLERKVEEVEDF